MEAAIAQLAGYSIEDYHEIEEAATRGLERARVKLILKGTVRE